MKPIINYDLLIANFMGATIEDEFLDENKNHSHYLLDMGKNRTQNERYWSSTTLKYCKYWDWIMPVVSKLEKEFNTSIVIATNYCSIGGVITSDPLEDKLMGLYYAIGMFLRHNYEQRT